ncbi:MAG: hypothetical protein R3B70_43190 [Polyangiaceae bacterium]
MKVAIQWHVQRLLAAVREIDGKRVIAYPDFSLFREGEPPGWWTEDLRQPEWGEVFGVYENKRGTGARAIVVTTEGLAVLGDDAQLDQWLRYVEVARWDRLSKDPISLALVVWKENGERVTLPFEARPGDAFSFVQFLSAARNAHRRARAADP